MSEPALTTAPDSPDIDEGLIVNGSINLRRTHPTLYRAATIVAAASVALGLNFALTVPTFLIFNQSKYLWATIFLVLGVSKLVFLNVWRKLPVVRVVMGGSVAFFLFLGLGTTQPFIEGNGSLQLPIFYFTVAAFELAALVEPFINPWTARRE